MYTKSDARDSETAVPRRPLFGGTRAEIAATLASFVILAIGMYLACRAVDTWAADGFAQPIMGSALVAVCDLGMFLVAICFAPPLSKILHLVAQRVLPQRPDQRQTQIEDPASVVSSETLKEL